MSSPHLCRSKRPLDTVAVLRAMSRHVRGPASWSPRPTIAAPVKFHALALDTLFIVLFVAIGRSAHEHGISLAGMTSTLWPFVTALAVGWLVTRQRRHSGEAPMDGVVIVLVTVALGMVLRVVSGQGTAVAFILVALSFLTLFLVGWRLVARLVLRRR